MSIKFLRYLQVCDQKYLHLVKMKFLSATYNWLTKPHMKKSPAPSIFPTAWDGMKLNYIPRLPTDTNEADLWRHEIDHLPLFHHHFCFRNYTLVTWSKCSHIVTSLSLSLSLSPSLISVIITGPILDFKLYVEVEDTNGGSPSTNHTCSKGSMYKTLNLSFLYFIYFL